MSTVNFTLWQRLRALLTPAEHRAGRRVSLAVFLGAILDFAGLAALLPGLLFLLDGGEGRGRAMLFCLAAVVFIVAKNLLMMALARYRSAFLLSLYRRLSLSLFRSYYRRGLLFIRERGSMRLGYEVNYLCYSLAFNVLDPLLRMAGEALLIIIVSVALLVYSPLMTGLLYGAFVPLVVVYVLLVRQRVKLYGERDLEERRRQSRLVVETMQGYPELELNAAFPLQYRSLDEGFERIRKDRLRLQVIQQTPLFLSELAVVLGLTLLVVFVEGDVRTSAGIFAVAAFRLLPAMRSLLGGWTTVQNAMYSLEVVEKGMGLASSQTDAPVADAPVADQPEETACLPWNHEIHFQQLGFEYLPGQPVLNAFTATIRKGEYVGLSGPSGVGKTTLFNLLMGFFPPSTGQITIDGTPLTPANRAAWQRHLGYVAQDIFVLHDTVARNVALGSERVDEERVRQVMRQACLQDWLDHLPDGLNTVLGEAGSTLSGGQKQRLGIARALYKQADVLLLDEATSALDNATERAVNDTIRQLKEQHPGLTVIVIAHRESTLAYCEKIILL
jgi:ABC-type multidrug transport system fused ATPase/permease subunit